MHTIKVTPNVPFECQCTSGKFIRLPKLIGNKIDSVARIESKLFFWPELVSSSQRTRPFVVRCGPESCLLELLL